MRQIYISIGNSDDKLLQKDWAQFVDDVDSAVDEHAERVHGRWFSGPSMPYQNACWCVEFSSDADEANMKAQLAVYAEFYDQDSIAWAQAETEFITP